MMKRKGVSTYISVLLLIVVTIAGGVMIYGYTIGWFGRLGGEGEMGTLSIDEVSASGATNLITAYVRNVGSSSVILDAVYVEGTLIADADVTVDTVAMTTATPITEGSIATVVIDATALTSGTTYQVKLVGVDNTQIIFSIKAD
ncbi:MAG: hypothetical protein ACERKS_11755 [Candidatus Bathyarchaeota archaeon]